MSGYESKPNEFELQPAQQRREKRRRVDFDVERDLLPHQIVLGGRIIRLEPIEYRFLLFLASRPYHAFSVKQIVTAVNETREETDPEVSEETLRDLVRSLRDKLGFFWDFVQVVPHIGYRFKP